MYLSMLKAGSFYFSFFSSLLHCVCVVWGFTQEVDRQQGQQLATTVKYHNPGTPEGVRHSLATGEVLKIFHLLQRF